MINKLYSIRDIKTDSYDSPFDSTNDATAKRFFSRILTNVPIMQDHPQDFTLHQVGTFDSTSGQITPLPAVQFLASGLDCVKTLKESPDETSKVSNDTPIQPSS